MKIKAIIHHLVSKRDMSGECHWFTTITNPENGKSITFSTPHSSNSEAFLSRLEINWTETYAITETLPIREFNAESKRVVKYHNSCKDQKIMDQIAEIFESATVSMV